MTVTTDVQSIVHDTDGSTTEFPIPFYFLRNADITAELIDAEGNLMVLVLGTDFNVTGAGQPNGGALVTTRVFASGYKLHVYRVVPVTQETQYQQNDAFPAKTTEKALDKLTMLIQQQKQTTDRALVVPRSDLNPNTTIPSARLRANRALGFDNNGNPVAIDLTLGSIIAPVVHSIAMLRLASKFLTSDVFVMDYYGDGNGGGGPYFKRYDIAPLGWENGGTQIVAADGAGWQLSYVKAVTLKQFGCRIDAAVGPSATDDTLRVQAAVDAMAGGRLYADAGKCKVTSEIRISRALVFDADPNMFTFLLATRNQNGIVVGDGTTAGRTATLSTTIRNINFNPFPGVAAFSEGTCVYLNFIAFVDILNCTFFGQDGGSKKLFNGVVAFQASEYNILKCRFSNLLGAGHYTYGSAGVANRTVDGRIDYCEFTEISSDAVYFGENTAGMTVNFPIMYNNSAWSIHVDSPAGPSGQNFFINQPDIEVDAGGGGVYVSRGSNVQIVGGWIGAGTTMGLVGLLVDQAGNGVACIGVRIDQLTVILSGPACELVGGEVTGDNATMQTGVTVNATATDTNIVGVRIRQWTRYGVVFNGAPFRCNVSGCVFKDIGILEILGVDATTVSNAPHVSGCQTDAAFAISAAAKLPLRFGRTFMQVTGAAAISSMQSLGPGAGMTIQAGSSGLNWTQAANLQLKGGTSVVQPEFSMMDFVCDGTTWYERGRNF